MLSANRTWLCMAAFLIATPALGQEPDYDVGFPDGAIMNAPCPPSFPALYPHMGMSFWGLSKYSMRQYDEYHATVLHTYAFNGLTIDEDWRITGTHHVAAAQCISAAYSFFTGTPAVIALLHNAQLTFLGRTSGGDNCGSYRYASSNDPCDSSGGGTGGGTGGDDDEAGGGEPDLCETLRLQTGSCYDVYVDGTYQGEVCC